MNIVKKILTNNNHICYKIFQNNEKKKCTISSKHIKIISQNLIHIITIPNIFDKA